MNNISIGICAYNEEENIGSLLHNLLVEQNLPPNSKVMVICSGCTDRTPQIVKDFCKRDNRIKLIIEDERKGKANALNILFKWAKSAAEILVLVNADALPEVSSINKLIQPFSDKNVGATGGRPMPVNGLQTLPNIVVHMIWDIHHRVSSYKVVKLSGELCAIRSSLIEKIPTNLATDEPYIEMLIRRGGYKVAYVPDAIVHIKGPDNFRELLKQRQRIRVGHLQIKSMEGFSPSTSSLRNILLSTMTVKSGLNIGRVSYFAYFLVVAFLEMFASLWARWDFGRNKIPYVWDMIKSTKKLC